MSYIRKEQEIIQVDQHRPHLFILGAGASIAATLPNGDRNGKKLPSMDNFIELLELQELVDSTGLQFLSQNFEVVYSEIYASKRFPEILEELEAKVYDYFYHLELPEEPNIYDYLVLSLREKDVIATFNWDPFLVQAILRNQQHFKMPKVLFLHGNVAIVACINRCMMGTQGQHCKKCNEFLQPTKLLYPIAEKDYHLDPFINNQWQHFQEALDQAFYVTIFGYGAPSSDKSAVEIMKNAWGSSEYRELEQIEFINIEAEEDLIDTWKDFIHTHHYEKVVNNFFDSWVAHHPRRSIEAFSNQYLMAKFIESNLIQQFKTLNELWNWLEPFKEAEESI
jgi:NAD-dependent SIR2 family protein deacetylase